MILGQFSDTIGLRISEKYGYGVRHKVKELAEMNHETEHT
jgi:hypothetical protein